MAPLLENVIIAAVLFVDDYSVALTWADGSTSVSSFRHLVGNDIFASLSEPAVFAQVKIGPRGRSLEWPSELDFCADALWLESHPEDATVSPSLHRESTS